MPSPDHSQRQADPPVSDPEEIDALPVLAEVRPLPAVAEAAPEPPAVRGPVATQVAALAATGFVAGAATIALMQRRRTRRALRRAPRRRGGPADQLIQVVGSRSFLVDVHLLGSRD